jgi:hypothetical protein
MLTILRRIVYGITLLAVLGVLTPAATVRADDAPNMQDYNTFWHVANDPTPPSPGLDYNTYWAEVQAKQIGQGQ